MGMLFDHGCDAITSVNFNLIIQRMLQAGGGTTAMLCIFISTLPFYALTFEEFYTGILVMPAFTGPDDAALAVLFFSCLTAYFGSEELWASEVDVFGFGTMRISHVFAYLLFTFESLSIIFGVVTNLWHCRNNEHFAKRYRPLAFFGHCAFMFALIGIYLGYTLLPGSVASTVYPKTTMLAYGGQFIQVILRILVSNVIQDIYNPYRRTILLGWALMGLNAISLVATGQPAINEGLLFLAINIISWGAVAHYIYYILQEFCAILDINVFTIKHKMVEDGKKLA